ncbi:MAG: aminodeoxychorismate/anthranilate synthase component II [Chitinophagia bacterium]|nr:aminodeoxychorismate/anthranilate synthase component II [Chitinophagia bacterium]
MFILIDNYDSFTHILHHYLLLTGHPCQVYRNDELTLSGLIALHPTRLILSPGPETPLKAGITLQAIDYFHNQIPILGICLGHQAIGMYFGGKLAELNEPVHGKTSQVVHQNHALFKGIESPFTAMRYHSLVITEIDNTPLQRIAHTQTDNVIMAIAHNQYPCLGLQFHPESVGTNTGMTMIKNWVGLG